LVYYEVHETYMEAARREKRFKNWCRQWKLNLIEELNPEWRDLYVDIFVADSDRLDAADKPRHVGGGVEL
jgi:putative endonuclease